MVQASRLHVLGIVRICRRGRLHHKPAYGHFAASEAQFHPTPLYDDRAIVGNIDSKNRGRQDESYSQGIELYRQGRYEQAISELAPLLAGESLCSRIARYYAAQSHRQIGQRALQDGQFDLAGKHFRQAMAIGGRAGGLCNYLAAIYAKAGKYQDCLEQAELANRDAEDAHSTRSLALAQWQAGRRAEAYMTLNRALRQRPSDCQLNLQLGLFYASEENYADARRHLVRALQADCGNVEIVYHLGLVAAAQNDLGSAVHYLQRAVELSEGDVMLAYQLALAGKAASQAGLSVKLRMAEAASPTLSHSPNTQLARYLCSETDFVDAFLALPASAADGELFGMLAEALESALAEHPAYADLHLRYSRTLERLGRPQDAVEHARRAIEINPKYTQAIIHLARLEAQGGRMQQAISHLSKAIDSGADWPDIHALMQQWRRQVDNEEQSQGRAKQASIRAA